MAQNTNPYEIDVTVPMRASYILYCAGIERRPEVVWATARDDDVTAEEWDLINQAECRAWDDLISTPMPSRYGSWARFRAEYEAMLTKPGPSEIVAMASTHSDLITLADAARLWGVSRSRAREIVRTRKLPITRIGGCRWLFVARADAERVALEPRPPGRPPKPDR